MKKYHLLFSWLLLSGCATKMFSSDPYVVGLRWYERGNLELAESYWKPLVEKGDCDAQFRMGLLYVDKPAATKSLSDQYRTESLKLINLAAARGQPKALMVLGELYWQSPNAKIKCPLCNIKKDLEKAGVNYTLAEKFAVYDYDQSAFKTTKEKIFEELNTKQKNAVGATVAQWKASPGQCKPRKLL
jgi:TPR repeat protein